MASATEYETESTTTDALFHPGSLNSPSGYYSSNNQVEDINLQLANTTITTTTDHSDEEYNMSHKNRGLALIFNQKHFLHKNLPTRVGTNKDCEDLTQCLKSLGFDVKIYQDYYYAQIRDKVEWAARQDHTNNDCIVIAIMSHGENGYIYAKDVSYKVDSILKNFTADNCTSLAGKPKLFFIQACRGKGLDSGIKLERKGTQTDGDSSFCYKIPVHADFLMAYSTIEGFYSWRSPTSGSWFIQSLCNELTNNGKCCDILTLLTFVCQRVAIDFESYCTENEKINKKKEIPCIVSMLTRILCFPDKNPMMASNSGVYNLQ